MCVDDAAPGIPAVPADPDPGAPRYAASDAPAPVYFASVTGFDQASAQLDGNMGSDYIYAQDGQLVTSADYTVPTSWTFSDASQAQLVACVVGNETTSASPQAAPCEYGAGVIAGQGSASVPVYKETYTITLYVARTGRILTSKTITGSNAKVCPTFVTTINGTPATTSTLTTILTVKDITSVIGKYASA